MQNPNITFDKLERSGSDLAYYFDIAAPAYYDFNDNFTADDIDYDPTDVFSISVHTELETDRTFNDDIICENCDSASAPYFWSNDHDMHSCLSHLPKSTQTYILDYINSYFS